MNKAVCPYLCAQDANNQPQPAIDYPSFENYCRATETELLLLADQATFCLSGEYRGCARFAAAPSTMEASRGFSAPGPRLGTPGPGRVDDPFGPENSDFFAHEPDVVTENPPTRRRWAWIGAAMIFATVLLCGGSWAAYVGWQMVSERALAARIGRVETLANLPAPATTPAYVVVTATSLAPITPTATSPVVITLAPLLAPTAYPVAVTPTPIVVQVNLGSAAPVTGALPAPIDANQLISTTAPPNVELPAPDLNLQVEIPTRRPTPLFDLPTGTPVALEPTPTPTPSPVLGTPVVIFAPVKKELLKNECTLLRWQVENVRAVYYENQGVNGKGEDEECIEDESVVYSLMVVLGDGSSKIYTTTITYLPPTVTPTPTPTFTPEITPEATPTWTPQVPTETPTPDVDYGVSLEIFGESRRTCPVGGNCEFELLVTNRGTARDNLAVNFTATGPWSTLLCVEGGDCSSSSLTVADVEAGSGKLVKLKISIPTDASGQSASYGLQAASLGSGGSATSNEVGVEVQAP